MNGKQARDFIAKFPGAKSFVKPSHLEELSPLLEVHIEAITVTKGEFHELEGGKTYMPRKETIDKFAAAAGVSYNAMSETTRKDGDGCYVGRSQAMVMGPDGKMILGDACEYEFDVGVRLEEIKINGAADWEHKNGNRPGRREHTELELAKERVNLMKVARQRANTGARSRATLQVLGMQTGFKGLFDKNEPDTAARTFLFSRIIVNAKNEMVMNAMLSNLGQATGALFGPQAAPALAAPPAAGESFRNVNEPGASAGDDPGDFGGQEEIDFGAPAGASAEPDPREAARNTLRDYVASDLLSPNQKAKISAAADDPTATLDSLMYYLDLCKKQAEIRERKRGAA